MKLSPIAVGVALLPNIAAALEPYQAPPMVITRATALEKPAPASTRVIDRNEIERSAASSLIEVLNGKAGIQIRDTLGDGNHASISLRGFGDNAVNNVLVLVDGRRLNNPSLSGPDLNSVPLANIERIEILRGAGTVLYGDQAVGGVSQHHHSPTHPATKPISKPRRAVTTWRPTGAMCRKRSGGGLSAYMPAARPGIPTTIATTTTPATATLFGRLRYEHANGWLAVRVPEYRRRAALPARPHHRAAPRRSQGQHLERMEQQQDRRASRCCRTGVLGRHWTG
jgi:iron complex outermembrane recepter protein